MDSTSTRSPPISCASAARSEVAVTIWIFAAACAGGGASVASSKARLAAMAVKRILFETCLMMSSILERMGAVRAEHKQKLEAKFVAVVPLGVSREPVLPANLAKLAWAVAGQRRPTGRAHAGLLA